jgi:hypothetical protein
MDWGMTRICNYLLVIAGLSVISLAAAQANDAPAKDAHANNSGQLSGTYQIVHQSEVDGQTRIQIQLHLENRGTHSLHIQRLTFWDFSHPAKGASRACSLTLDSSASADTTQDFTIPRAEFELWKRGARPRLLLQIETQHGPPTIAVVHLRIASGKGN